MASVVFTIIAAVLAIATLLQASSTNTPYDNYGSCEPLNKYNIACFNLTMMCNKRLYVQYATVYDLKDLTDAVVTVDCFDDGTIVATYSYSLDGHNEKAIFAYLEQISNGCIKWTINQNGQIFVLQERIFTVYADADNTDLIVSSVICTDFARAMVSQVVSIVIAILSVAVLHVNGTIYDDVGSCELKDALYIPGLRIEAFCNKMFYLRYVSGKNAECTNAGTMRIDCDCTCADNITATYYLVRNGIDQQPITYILMDKGCGLFEANYTEAGVLYRLNLVLLSYYIDTSGQMAMSMLHCSDYATNSGLFVRTIWTSSLVMDCTDMVNVDNEKFPRGQNPLYVVPNQPPLPIP